MHNNKVILRKREVIPIFSDSMIPVDCCQNNSSIINFTTDNMKSKFELVSKNKMNNLYLTKSM